MNTLIPSFLAKLDTGCPCVVNIYFVFYTQVRLKREHLNVAKFEPENGLDPLLDLALVGSEWQFRIQSRASNWQDKLVVTSTRSVEQDALSPSEVHLKSKR